MSEPVTQAHCDKNTGEILAELREIKRHLFVGNGSPPIMARLTKLETAYKIMSAAVAILAVAIVGEIVRRIAT